MALTVSCSERVRRADKSDTCGSYGYGGGKHDNTDIHCFRKTGHAKFKGDGQGWQAAEIADTINIFDNGESRTPILICVSHTG